MSDIGWGAWCSCLTNKLMNFFNFPWFSSHLFWIPNRSAFLTKQYVVSKSQSDHLVLTWNVCWPEERNTTAPITTKFRFHSNLQLESLTVSPLPFKFPMARKDGNCKPSQRDHHPTTVTSDKSRALQIWVGDPCDDLDHSSIPAKVVSAKAALASIRTGSRLSLTLTRVWPLDFLSTNGSSIAARSLAFLPGASFSASPTLMSSAGFQTSFSSQPRCFARA